MPDRPPATPLFAQIQRSWSATQFLCLGLPVAVLCFFLSFLVPTALLLTAVVIGAPAWPEVVRLLRQAAGYERVRIAARLPAPVPELYLPLDGAPTDRIRLALIDPGTWRDSLWLLVAAVVYPLYAIAVLPLWAVGLLVDGVVLGTGGALGGRHDEARDAEAGTTRGPIPARQPPPRSPVLRHIERLADAQAALSARLLRPSASSRLTERVAELSNTRAAAVEAHSAELRRIERDLHDGVQAQLVALSLRIGLARQLVRTDPEAALSRLGEAQSGIEGALVDLRGVVRTVHPPVLTDRGLAGAVRALAASSGIPVETHLNSLEHGHRLPASVEAAAYFAVAEALTNVAKHSNASRAWVRFTRGNGELRITVTDNGDGGARESHGGGLVGVRRRVSALDGTTELTSPPKGPTELKVRLPCGS